MRPSTADGISASRLMPGLSFLYVLLAELGVGGLRLERPDDLRRQLARAVPLPLDVDHLVADLLAVQLRVGRELDATVEREEVHLVERGADRLGAGAPRLFQRALEREPGGVTPRRVIRRRRVVLRLVRLHEDVTGRAVERDVQGLGGVGRVFRLRLPLARADDELGGRADVGEGGLPATILLMNGAKSVVLLS